jgi:hypothetical protein
LLGARIYTLGITFEYPENSFWQTFGPWGASCHSSNLYALEELEGGVNKFDAYFPKYVQQLFYPVASVKQKNRSKFMPCGRL